MKGYYSLILLIFSSGLVLNHVTDKSCNVYKTVSEMTLDLPQMKRKIELNPSSQSPKIAPILKGFKTLKPSIEVYNFNEVPIESLNKFLNKLNKQIDLPSKLQKGFNEKLSLIAYSDFNEMLLNDFIFSTGKGGQCKYVNILAQKNNDGTTDWLVGDVKAKFELEPDIYVFQQTKKVLFGKPKTKTVTQKVPKVLTQEIMDALTDFLQCNVIERFASSLHIPL